MSNVSSERLKARYAAERRFRALGLIAVVFSALVLAFLLFTMTANAVGGFKRAELRFTVDLAASGITADPASLADNDALNRLETAGLPEVVTMAATKALGAEAAAELDPQAWRELGRAIAADPVLLQGTVEAALPASDDLAAALRGDGANEGLKTLAEKLAADGKLERAWDPGFLSRADATGPQAVGIWGALKGSMLTMLVTLLLAFPVGVLAAVYLEEYAPKNRWTDVIEVSINNLAAVPSIIFGLLGLAVFLWIFPNYRSAPLIGGMTLALMTMPVIVISGRNAIKSVPPSIRDAALAVGASRVQTVFHHVLPLALPGILTGTIIGMARALGETAPLLMIGMRAFVASPPEGFTSPASVLPVQIFLWSDEIDRGFVERTSAAIIILLLFLLVMNGLAIYLRNRFEKRW
ncbi:phosphate ABC transporter permease PstA [Novosphingobium sp.]|jgi:phosphate transport system permease protein|uniref:phosphate ABC transporter permease PstA n=1 Tax=Novosphingobium sp. TaxID=1874826 RepID=UPI0022C94878|nr:phosphate ABC transporter permease PstA [Novosphingobium sp.]MCZ8017552.1 phosphate ABC transporter permease PstA [Novosphingobium sp.]MCZ8033924.1 phosphate ABC transporter permease PstA [Novosphingobium sp.]MCZ8051280.1 phosphate ABC transporter permease PstA [Novosphingobium sp.]MCZ8059626.1 phosphate ABC transporter permease PstA [Novosphingobium sp.]MCZ8231464.1 phosphate ABC transporter permease PstA [Novosphingobium sp.]